MINKVTTENSECHVPSVETPRAKVPLKFHGLQ